MTAVAAALLQADASRRQIEFVVDDENFRWRNFVEICQSGHSLSRTVHESRRLQQPKFAGASRLAEKLCLRREVDFHLRSQLVNEPEADIVACGFVFRSWIAQTDDEAGKGHDVASEKAAGGKMPAAARKTEGRRLLGGSFALGSLCAALADDADNDRIVFTVLDQGNTCRQLDLGSVDVVTDVHGAEVNFDEFRQITG